MLGTTIANILNLIQIIMKSKRVDCTYCQNFVDPKQVDENNLISKVVIPAKCQLGKRVMFRMPVYTYSQMAQDSGGWFRYCNDFKELEAS